MITKRRLHGVSMLPMAMVGLTLGATTPAVGAAKFSEAELYFELNDTDGDLGIHSSIDGGAYSRLTITDPNKHTILKVRPRGRLASQGLTQLFFESAEPKFAELDPATFFLRFPEGAYDIRARTLTGQVLKATVALSQVLAAPVANITVSGVPAAASCDAVPLPSVSEPVLIDWDPVAQSHPEIGKSGPVEIVRYQFFVEREGVKLSVDLPPEVTEFEVPSDVTALGNEFKFEIIARTASGNNTAIENCFTVR
jgi:hypothetical protein